MDNLRRFDTVIYVLLAVLLGCRYCLEVTQRPSNSTVLQGSQALFNCTVKGEWKSILWFSKGTPVVIIIKATGTTVLHSSFSAANYTEPNSYTSELIISNVNISDAGPVACNAFASEYFTAYLSVQEALEENDNTEVIIIAVVVPIAAVLLLIIIIVIIVVCCRRKQEESSYQSQLKKVSAQRAKDLSTISKSDVGEANHGYDAEQSVNRRPLPNSPSDSSGISSSFDPDKNVGDDSTSEVSDAYNGAFHPGIRQYSTSPWKVRHVTHV